MKIAIGLFLLISECFCIYSLPFDPHTGTHLDKKFLEKIKSPSPELISRHDVLKLLPKGGKFAEIGVGDGDFAVSIKKNSNPTELYLIDCWEQQPRSVYPDDFNVSTPQQLKRYESVKKMFANDLEVQVLRMYSKDAAQLFPDDYFDWVYIDSNHTYSAVKEDLETWFKKVKNGGYICGHDYALPREVGIPFGVVPAVNEFIDKYALELLYLTIEKFATYVIKVRK